jgi:hypothetical protein
MARAGSVSGPIIIELPYAGLGEQLALIETKAAALRQKAAERN